MHFGSWTLDQQVADATGRKILGLPDDRRAELTDKLEPGEVKMRIEDARPNHVTVYLVVTWPCESQR